MYQYLCEVEKKHLPTTAEIQVHFPAAMPLAWLGVHSKSTGRFIIRILFVYLFIYFELSIPTMSDQNSWAERAALSQSTIKHMPWKLHYPPIEHNYAAVRLEKDTMVCISYEC